MLPGAVGTKEHSFHVSQQPSADSPLGLSCEKLIGHTWHLTTRQNQLTTIVDVAAASPQDGRYDNNDARARFILHTNDVATYCIQQQSTKAEVAVWARQRQVFGGGQLIR